MPEQGQVLGVDAGPGAGPGDFEGQSAYYRAHDGFRQKNVVGERVVRHGSGRRPARTGYKFVTATDLMRMWLTDFEKKYDVSTQKLAEVVGAKGKTTEAQPPAGWHFNLTGDARHEQR
jgi:hypothetical protein